MLIDNFLWEKTSNFRVMDYSWHSCRKMKSLEWKVWKARYADFMHIRQMAALVSPGHNPAENV